jgi:hypothetical protein
MKILSVFQTFSQATTCTYVWGKSPRSQQRPAREKSKSWGMYIVGNADLLLQAPREAAEEVEEAHILK